MAVTLRYVSPRKPASDRDYEIETIFKSYIGHVWEYRWKWRLRCDTFRAQTGPSKIGPLYLEQKSLGDAGTDEEEICKTWQLRLPAVGGNVSSYCSAVIVRTPMGRDDLLCWRTTLNSVLKGTQFHWQVSYWLFRCFHLAGLKFMFIYVFH